MKTKKDLIKAWFIKANRDLLAAQHELTFPDPVTESICFHCQQAVEKYLKAYLIYLDIPIVKTHEIGELITKIEVEDDGIGNLKLEADKLTDYAVNIRYPDEPNEPSIQDAQEAYTLAKAIKEYILEKFNVG